MENIRVLEEALRLIGIHDNMILSDTMNISGNFIMENRMLKSIERMKITVEFEVNLIGK